MAAPNIVGVTTVVGVTTFLSLADTSATVLVNNPVDITVLYCSTTSAFTK